MASRVVLPWLTATLLLKPRVGPLRRDRVLDRLAFWRTMVGMAAVAAVTYQHQPIHTILVSNYLKATETGRLAAFLLPLPFLVMISVTRPGHRADLLPGALRLLGRAALALTFFYLPIALILAAGGKYVGDSRGNGAIEFSFDSDVNESGVAALGMFALILFLIAFALWFACLWCCTIYWATRTGFWMAEIHPLLAPIGPTALTLVITMNELIRFDPKGVPAPLWLTLTLCGAISTLVLAALEYRHLRSIGYRFRSGPHPVPDVDKSLAGLDLVATPAKTPPAR